MPGLLIKKHTGVYFCSNRHDGISIISLTALYTQTTWTVGWLFKPSPPGLKPIRVLSPLHTSAMYDHRATTLQENESACAKASLIDAGRHTTVRLSQMSVKMGTTHVLVLSPLQRPQLVLTADFSTMEIPDKSQRTIRVHSTAAYSKARFGACLHSAYISYHRYMITHIIC